MILMGVAGQALTGFRAGGLEDYWYPTSTRAGGLGALVDLGELVVGAGRADFEAFGFAGPAFAFGFCDTGSIPGTKTHTLPR